MPFRLPSSELFTSAGSSVADQFGALQLVLLILLSISALRFLKQSSRGSHFREDAFTGTRSGNKAARSTASRARERERNRDRERLLLGGFSFTGQPHEILGVSKDASELEIRRAHRALIKRFHPDVIGEQGTREWYEAQKIAETLNTARDRMLRDLRSST